MATAQKWVVDLPIGRAFVDQTGFAVLMLETEKTDGTAAVVALTAKDLAAMNRLLASVEYTARRQADSISGRTKWVIVDRKGDLVLVKHYDALVWLRPSKLVRALRGGCTACGRAVEKGERVYRENEVTRYETNLRNVRLCVGCLVDAPPGTVSIFSKKRRTAR
jgi:23S rRNA G2069 N7-methylase RlmK/C1962 C5-methylase RlmI